MVKNREAAAILTNVAIRQFHEISLSLNSNKSVSICTEHDHLDERPLSINSYHNNFSLYKRTKISYLGIDFLIKYSYTQLNSPDLLIGSQSTAKSRTKIFNTGNQYLAVDHSKKLGYISHPTVRFETYDEQLLDVDMDRKQIY